MNETSSPVQAECDDVAVLASKSVGTVRGWRLYIRLQVEGHFREYEEMSAGPAAQCSQ
jgi:hypothetical protein